MSEKYPEHEKLHVVKDESQTVGAFLDWLQREDEKWICTFKANDSINGGEFCPTHECIESVLERYFKIDGKKVEEEKRAMLEEIRAGVSP